MHITVSLGQLVVLHSIGWQHGYSFYLLDGGSHWYWTELHGIKSFAMMRLMLMSCLMFEELPETIDCKADLFVRVIKCIVEII